MDKHGALKFICEIPIFFRKDGKITYYTLFNKASEFIKKFGLSREDFIMYLKNNPKYIEVWHEYAQDKRWTPAYYLSYENGKYSFGIKAKNSCDDKIYEISEQPYELCADFILKDCEHISSL
jgi:hypothetical protein